MTTTTKIKLFIQGTIWAGSFVLIFIGLANIYLGFVHDNFWQGQAGIWQVLGASFMTQVLDHKSS